MAAKATQFLNLLPFQRKTWYITEEVDEKSVPVCLGISKPKRIIVYQPPAVFPCLHGLSMSFAFFFLNCFAACTAWPDAFSVLEHLRALRTYEQAVGDAGVYDAAGLNGWTWQWTEMMHMCCFTFTGRVGLEMCLESPDHPDSSDSQTALVVKRPGFPVPNFETQHCGTAWRVPGPGPHPPVAETDLAAWRHRPETMEVPWLDDKKYKHRSLSEMEK